MKLFEGKSKTERNKIVAAIVLGVMCLVVFYLAFGRNMFSGSSTTTVTVKTSPTPKSQTTASQDPDKFKLPSKEEQFNIDGSTPISYNQNSFYAPDPGRNIFAFYEPPLPCKENCPTPIPPPIVTPKPIVTPTPDIQIAFLNPASVYAGSKGFRLEIAGDHFTPDTRIYFVSINRAPQKQDKWDVVDAANGIIRAFCERTGNMGFIDVNPALFDAEGKARLELYLPDKLHFLEPAYVEFTKIIKPVLTKAWAER